MTTPTLGNNTVMQIGIIVRDIESKARAWSEILGLPMPDIIITDTVDKTQAVYNGKPTPARARLAFFHMGQLDVELIEPIDGPSTWKDQLDGHGDSLHHIASSNWRSPSRIWQRLYNIDELMMNEFQER